MVEKHKLDLIEPAPRTARLFCLSKAFLASFSMLIEKNSLQCRIDHKSVRAAISHWECLSVRYSALCGFHEV
jgi:hypothetical protein